MRDVGALLMGAAMFTGAVVLICQGVTLAHGPLVLLGAVVSAGFVASVRSPTPEALR